MVVTLHVTSAAIGYDLSLVEVFYLYRLLPVYHTTVHVTKFHDIIE